MTWPCLDCGTRWPDAVPTCIACLARDRDGAVSALATSSRDHDRLQARLAVAAEALRRITSPRSGHMSRDGLRDVARDALAELEAPA